MVSKLKAVVLHPKEWVQYRDIMDVRHVSIGGNVPKRLDGNATWDGIGEVTTQQGRNDLLYTVREHKPDVFLMGIHFNLEVDTLLKCKEISPKMKICMHFTDQREGVSGEVSKYINILDLLMVTNKDKMDHRKYLDSGIPHVVSFYDGFNPESYWPMPKESSYEVFFGGNNHYNLCQYMKKIGRKPPEILNFPRGLFRHNLLVEVNRHFHLIVRGMYGWNDLDEFIVKSVHFHPNYLSVMREADIILGTAVAPRRCLYMRRLFRSIASGRLTVMEYTPGMEIDWINHCHFVWFYTIEEAIDIIGYYLNHEEAREKIARKGRQFLLERHTYRHRLIEFDKIVRRIL